MTEETGDTGGTGETVDPFLDQGDQGRKFSVGKAGWKILVKNFWLKYLDRQCEDMAKILTKFAIPIIFTIHSGGDDIGERRAKEPDCGIEAEKYSEFKSQMKKYAKQHPDPGSISK